MNPLTKLYLRTFLLTGIPYGIMMIGFDLMDGDEVTLWKFLFLTISFGLLMSLTLVGFHRYRLRKSGVKDMDEASLAVRQEKMIQSSFNLPQAMKALEADPDVHLTGWLDDIRDGYRQGKIFVAPLFAGSGQQNKILEAMAMGLPCIVTPIVNEAIGARDGQEIFVASEVEEMIQLSRLLLENEDKRRLTGAAARAFVESTYDWNAVASQVDSWLFPEK